MTHRQTDAPADMKPLADFLSVLARVVGSAPRNDAAMLEHLRVAMKVLISQDEWLEESFAKPHPDHGQQYLLYGDPLGRFSVVSVVWGPGHSTPIHDHTVWGVVGVLRGAEVEETFELQAGRPHRVRTAKLEKGQVTFFSPAVGDIHRVRNAYDDRSTISIHAYGGEIGSIDRHAYSLDGAMLPFRTGYANRRLPNPFFSRPPHD